VYSIGLPVYASLPDGSGVPPLDKSQLRSGETEPGNAPSLAENEFIGLGEQRSIKLQLCQFAARLELLALPFQGAG